MAENALQTAQSFMQDVLAPDVRELKVKVDALDKRIDLLDKRIDPLERHINERFAAAKDQSDANMREILGAIKRLELMTENTVLRATADLRERVAVLEAKAA
jgi:chaperonin cofactor prefoldin